MRRVIKNRNVSKLAPLSATYLATVVENSLKSHMIDHSRLIEVDFEVVAPDGHVSTIPSLIEFLLYDFLM